MRNTAPAQTQPHDRSADGLLEQFSGVSIGNNRSNSPGRDLDQYNFENGSNNQSYNNHYNQGFNPQQQQQQQHQQQQKYNQYGGFNGYQNNVPSGYDPGYGYTGGYEGGYNGQQRRVPQMGYSLSQESNGYRSGSLPRGRKESTSFEQSEPVPTHILWPRPEQRPWEDMVEIMVTLLRHDSGFGFRIVGGTEEGSQVRDSQVSNPHYCTSSSAQCAVCIVYPSIHYSNLPFLQVSIGHIVPGGAADLDGRLFSGDEIVAVDGQSVMGASHHVVVGMMGHAAQRGLVALTVRRRQPQGELQTLSHSQQSTV